ncbi:MAG: hypothetical protein FWH24_01760 [Oscillospiraceae bacterium]|nr:hypothetical protein [Oscillospiraceae bacterium]
MEKLKNEIEASVKMIREKAGETGKVIALVSGGVDGMVTAALLLKALPAENIYAIHVDHGFMRKNESAEVKGMLEGFGFKNVAVVDARNEFLNERAEIDGKLMPPLCEVTDPEQKRKIIGNMFIKIVKQAADTFGLDYNKVFIAQGTLKPDLLESGNRQLIKDSGGFVKTHHNDVDIVRKAREKGMIIETNWNWYKEDVRQAARILGIAEATASRQPFPGPGLAVRIVCAAETIKINDENNNKFKEFLKSTNISGIIAPVLSVGVGGGARSYKNPAVLYGEADFDKLAKITAEMPDKLDFINRCAYVLNKKSIDKLICGKLLLSEQSAELVRGIDYIITDEINKYLKAGGKNITQYFGVLLPVNSGGAGKYSAVIRAVITTDFMTGRAALPGVDIPVEVLSGIADRIAAEHSEIDLVLYDMTGKPPATVEWE